MLSLYILNIFAFKFYLLIFSPPVNFSIYSHHSIRYAFFFSLLQLIFLFLCCLTDLVVLYLLVFIFYAYLFHILVIWKREILIIEYVIIKF